MTSAVEIAALTLTLVGLIAVTAAWTTRVTSRDPAPDPIEQQVGSWACPDCGTEVPVMARATRVVVMRLDPTDIAAHALTHEETRP